VLVLHTEGHKVKSSVPHHEAKIITILDSSRTF
jgi:hypothetical protein